ncbi:uncharacterized protein EI90DRAFT_3025049 [Cantharellus anzutake]|uniref:uncharacterized protein n=1 Tax=Cantharellus anzutake TaxID=1750568 RepID=UPI00190388FA|nr:uncharacterized protein EI90DRAFT_3025049 [Cantharellus anzutake]KAF8309601.1 hypothetical protein EI90DRAFT_3025049 [Cantharellus anzutake]
MRGQQPLVGYVKYFVTVPLIIPQSTALMVFLYSCQLGNRDPLLNYILSALKHRFHSCPDSLLIKNLNESDGPETLKQIKEIIGNHQTRDGDDAILYKILEALRAVDKLNSLLLSPNALKTSVMGVFLESVVSLCWCHIQPDTKPVKSSRFNSILHVASQSIPPYLLATSIVSFAMESFESGDPVAARLIAFRGQEAIKGRHSVVLTILKDTELHVTSLIWLPWETPDTECDTVMSRLLPLYLTCFLDPCCGDSQWMWERWGRVTGKPTSFRHHMYCEIVCEACRQRVRLTLCPDEKTSPIPPIFLYPNTMPFKPQNWVQDHFEMSLLPSRLDKNISWAPKAEKNVI